MTRPTPEELYGKERWAELKAMYSETDPRNPECIASGHEEAESMLGPWAAHIVCSRCKFVVRPFSEDDWDGLM